MICSRLTATFTNALAISVVAGALAMPCAAQEVRGEVRDRASDLRIAGAVLTVIDSGGAVLSRVSSDGSGQYRATLGGASAAIRVVRIGFRPVVVPLTTIDRTRLLVIRMDRLPTLLEPLAVKANPRCPGRRESGAAFGLLEQIRASLLNSVVAAESPGMALVRVGYRRRVELKSNRILNQVVWIDSASKTGTSFAALHSPADFVERGFVRPDSAGGVSYYAPDAEVLLSNDFASTYCFRLLQRGAGQPSEVLLAFARPGRQGARVDLDGTVAVDTASRRVTRIDFSYAGRDQALSRVNAGGWLTFNELSDGAVFVDRWAVRSPYIYKDSTTSGVTSTLEIREGGGEVAAAASPGSQRYEARLGTMRVSMRTAAGAAAPLITVRLDSTDYLTRTDSAGIATITRLLPGPYDITVLDPRVVALGAGLPTGQRFVAQRDSTFEATVVVPTLESDAARRCQDPSAKRPPRRRSDGGWMFGKIVDSTGLPLAGASVTASRWRGTALDSLVPAIKARATDGFFALCPDNFIVGDTVQVEVSYGNWAPVSFLTILSQPISVFAPVVLLPAKRR